MSIIWMPSSSALATTAYVLPDIWVIPTLWAPSSSVKPSTPSVMAATGAGSAGLVMSIIWMPSSSALATTAYVLPDIWVIPTLWAPSSSVKPSTPSVMAATGAGSAGLVMSII